MDTQSNEGTETAKASSRVGWFLALLGALASILYLSNPIPFGVDFIPDTIPGIGNIDDALITTFLIACLARMGINVIPGLNRGRRRETIVDPPHKKSPPDDA